MSSLQDQIELEPCPWCERTEYLTVNKVGSMTGDMPARPYRVICSHIDHDDVSGPVAYGRAAAMAAWNRRAPSAALQTLQQELEQALDSIRFRDDLIVDLRAALPEEIEDRIVSQAHWRRAARMNTIAQMAQAALPQGDA